MPKKKSKSRLAHSMKPSPLQFDCETLEERCMLSTLTVLAAGAEGTETLELQIDGQTVQTWSNLGGDANAEQYVALEYTTPDSVVADQVRLVFTNDFYDPANGVDRNVRVDAIVLDGVRFETEGPNVYSTGTWLPEDGVVPGFRQNEYLHSDGYLQYSGGPISNLLSVRARGDEGGEQFEVFIDGQSVGNFTTTVDFIDFDIPLVEAVAASQVRVQFTNDFYDPANNIDGNLIVDSISIDGVVFETEAASVFSTGTWITGQGIVPGFFQTDILHSNGYFQYDANANPGVISLTLDALTIDEGLGQLSVVVFRTGGTDGTVTVDYDTVGDTADGSDFGDISGTLTFADGVSSQQLTIQIFDDSVIEPDESFSFVISNPTGGATLGQIATEVITITDNDEPQAGIVFEDSFESGNFWTTDPFGSDDATTGQWATGAPEQTTASSGETLQLGSGNTGSRALVTGLAAGANIGSFDVDGGETTVASPIINLPAGDDLELRFAYNFAHLANATSDDYLEVAILSNGVESQVFIQRGNGSVRSGTWQNVSIDLSSFAGDQIQIVVRSADESGGSLVEAAIDDVVIELLPDAPGTLNLAATDINLDEDAGTATMRIVRTNGRSGVVLVQYATQTGTAGSSDFGERSGTLVFADGETEKTVVISIVDDLLDEDLESFTFNILSPTGGAVLGTAIQTLITIADNDSTVPDFLPDLIPIPATMIEQLYVDTNEIPGRRLLRFSTEVANVGTGPLEIWGGSTSGSSQQVFQRVYQDDGGSRDRLAGDFVYHANHGHVHFEGLATYDLRSATGSQSVVASGGKTSFCLINIRQPFPNVTAAAGRVHGRGGDSCGQTQGISTGYSDVYSASLDDQWIDITNVADGDYWLEITADPTNRVQESDESNNFGRVLITIDNGQPSVASVAAPGAPTEAADSYELGADRVIVALIDTGVDFGNTALSGSIWTNPNEVPGDGIDNDGNGFIDDLHGYDFIDNDALASDENGHGTFSASVIGGAGVGIAVGAEIMVLRAIGADGTGNAQAVADAIRYAVDNGADVIALPVQLGNNLEIRAAVEYSATQNVLIVAAAGNASSSTPSFVAGLSAEFGNVISVGAVSVDGELLPESNGVGESGAVQIDALGVRFGALLNGQFGTYRGTSVAASTVAGAAAVIAAKNPNLTSNQLRDVLVASATESSESSDSVGRLSIDGAVMLSAQFGQVRIETRGRRTFITGTDESNTFELDMGRRLLFVDGVSIPLDARTTKIVIDAAGGQDVLQWRGTAGNDRVRWRNDRLQVRSPGLQLSARDFETWELDARQGDDTLNAIGARDDSAVVIGRQRLVLASASSIVVARQFERTRIVARGRDVLAVQAAAVGTPAAVAWYLPSLQVDLIGFDLFELDDDEPQTVALRAALRHWDLT